MSHALAIIAYVMLFVSCHGFRWTPAAPRRTLSYQAVSERTRSEFERSFARQQEESGGAGGSANIEGLIGLDQGLGEAEEWRVENAGSEGCLKHAGVKEEAWLWTTSGIYESLLLGAHWAFSTLWRCRRGVQYLCN